MAKIIILQKEHEPSYSNILALHHLVYCDTTLKTCNKVRYEGMKGILSVK